MPFITEQSSEHSGSFRNDIIEILKALKGPETGLSLFELGIIRAVDYYPVRVVSIWHGRYRMG